MRGRENRAGMTKPGAIARIARYIKSFLRRGKQKTAFRGFLVWLEFMAPPYHSRFGAQMVLCTTRIAPKFPVTVPQNARQSGKDCLRFLDHLTKNFGAPHHLG